MGSISVAVVRGFELPKQGRQMILPGEGAEQQRLNLARSMLLATSVVVGARIGRVDLPFSAIDHSRPVERDACGLVGSEVGRKKLLPFHIRGTGVLSPERLVDPRVVVLDDRGVRRHAVTGGVDGLSDRCGSAGVGPVDGRGVRLGCLVLLGVVLGLFVDLRLLRPPLRALSKEKGSRFARYSVLKELERLVFFSLVARS